MRTSRRRDWIHGCGRRSGGGWIRPRRAGRPAPSVGGGAAGPGGVLRVLGPVVSGRVPARQARVGGSAGAWRGARGVRPARVLDSVTSRFFHEGLVDSASLAAVPGGGGFEAGLEAPGASDGPGAGGPAGRPAAPGAGAPESPDSGPGGRTGPRRRPGLRWSTRGRGSRRGCRTARRSSPIPAGGWPRPRKRASRPGGPGRGRRGGEAPFRVAEGDGLVVPVAGVRPSAGAVEVMERIPALARSADRFGREVVEVAREPGERREPARWVGRYLDVADLRGGARASIRDAGTATAPGGRGARRRTGCGTRSSCWRTCGWCPIGTSGRSASTGTGSRRAAASAACSRRGSSRSGRFSPGGPGPGRRGAASRCWR